MKVLMVAIFVAYGGILSGCKGELNKSDSPVNISNLERAKEISYLRGEIDRIAEEVGISCALDYPACGEMVIRAKENPELSTLFLRAKALGVRIVPEKNDSPCPGLGRVGPGFIIICIENTDKEIIDFLTK